MCSETLPDLRVVAARGGGSSGAAPASLQGEHVLVVEVYVVPDERGTGIGTRLLHAVTAAARRRGYDELLLGAVVAAEGFYLRNGFRPLLFVQVEGTDGPQRLYTCGSPVTRRGAR